MTAQDLPPINASLNALSTVFIIIGLATIKAERKRAHIAAMTAALVTSTLFLACYLTYHFTVSGLTRFTHTGWPRTLYLTILLTHTVLAVAVVPLVLLTVIPALRARWDRHRRIGRWAMPIWLYVSVTGVLVYFMLYQWFPPGG